MPSPPPPFMNPSRPPPGAENAQIPQPPLAMFYPPPMGLQTYAVSGPNGIMRPYPPILAPVYPYAAGEMMQQPGPPMYSTPSTAQPFECTQCGFQTFDADTMGRHITSSHQHPQAGPVPMMHSKVLPSMPGPQPPTPPISVPPAGTINHAGMYVPPAVTPLMQLSQAAHDHRQANMTSPAVTPQTAEDDVSQKRQQRKATSSGPLSSSADESRLCTLCQRLFASRSSLRRHIRRHKGVRPYRCNLCSKAYTAKHNLDYHRRSAHRMGNVLPANGQISPPAGMNNLSIQFFETIQKPSDSEQEAKSENSPETPDHSSSGSALLENGIPQPVLPLTH